MTRTTADPDPRSLTIRHVTGADVTHALRSLSALTEAAAKADANPPFSEQTWVALRGADSDAASGPGAWLAEAGGELRGAAVLLTDDDVPLCELVVAPEFRRRGIGTELAAAVAAAVDPGRGLRAWAHGGHPGAQSLAQKHDLDPVRELWRMRLDAETELQQPSVPEGLRIRAFVPGQDDQALLQVNAEAFAHHPEQGQMDQADLAARMAEDWFDPHGLLLAVDATDQIQAFHWTKIDPPATDDAGNPLGEVYVVGVGPQAQGRGLGKLMTVAGINWLIRAGLQHLVLYVDADNRPAVQLYRKLGFTLWSRDVMYSAGGVPAGQ